MASTGWSSTGGRFCRIFAKNNKSLRNDSFRGLAFYAGSGILEKKRVRKKAGSSETGIAGRAAHEAFDSKKVAAAGEAAVLRRPCRRASVSAGHAGYLLACRWARHRQVPVRSISHVLFSGRCFVACGRGVAGTALSLPEVRRPFVDAAHIWPETTPILRKLRNKNRDFRRTE